jgi:hypothetical protein
MAVIDDRGRVGGRVNLIDAVVAFLILVLIPVAFGAYLLFRTPAATLTAVVPPMLYQGANLRVEVNGQNLRPFMRVRIGSLQGRTFMIGGTRGAMVDLPDLGPGVYDVSLYDYMQEVSRLPKALTILPLAPLPTVEMLVEGSFKGLTGDRAAMLKPAARFPATGDPVAEVVSVGARRPSVISLKAGLNTLQLAVAGQTDVPAVLKVKCGVMTNSDGTLKCSAPGPVQQTDIAPGAMLSLAGAGGWMPFQIDKIVESGGR